MPYSERRRISALCDRLAGEKHAGGHCNEKRLDSPTDRGIIGGFNKHNVRAGLCRKPPFSHIFHAWRVSIIWFQSSAAFIGFVERCNGVVVSLNMTKMLVCACQIP
jgi:hypothetical protein